MGQPVELAFAGAGWIAAVHGYAVEHVADLSITNVASRDPARAAEAARRLGAGACTYADLPAGADGVVVCTPPAQHADHVLSSSAGGAAVLVEKPLCTTLADADRLVQAAEGGARIAYAENLLHAPAVRMAIDHASQIGAIDVLEVRALQSRPTWGDFLTTGWGGGVLFDLGVHPLSVALLLAGTARPAAVRCVREGADDHPVDEHADRVLRFDSGLEARVVTSWREAGTPTWDAQAASASGVVRLELLPEVRVERDGDDLELPKAPDGVVPQLYELGYLDQLSTFADDVRADRAPALGAAFGRDVLDVVCGAYQSAGQDGGWVALPFEGPRDRTPLELWRHP
ncbi:MAG: Gfo/Idh/MocA family oxidoreductase [Acidimicrobiales bacterium]|nr:Gfo/Idh/MocA family oxidoreductase [Acidimicrobiales bacterium]